jgi:5'-phosphate synthase pdxT subunit
MRVAVLALQGAFDAHVRALGDLGHDAFEARTAAALDGADGLVLPGGESTVMLRLLDRFDLERPLSEVVRSGRPVLATCAGVILLARAVRRPAQRSLALLDVAVARNAWGRQVASFEATGDRGTPMTFIRAPRIVEVGPRARVLETLSGEPVLVRDANVTGATFHPELTPDRAVHRAAFGAA